MITDVNCNYINFNFKYTQKKQKKLIECLLSAETLDLVKLSLLLNTSDQMLIEVLKGNIYFDNDTSMQLAALFLIHFGG